MRSTLTKKILPIFLLLGVSVFMVGGRKGVEKQWKKGMQLPVEHFKTTMRIDDDPMELAATFSVVVQFKMKCPKQRPKNNVN